MIFKEKFIRILIPYFIWAFLFLFPYMLFGKNTGNSIKVKSSFQISYLLINILMGNGNDSSLKQNSALWFLPALFSMEIVYYFIIKFIFLSYF